MEARRCSCTGISCRWREHKKGFSMASIMQHKNIPQRKCCLATFLWQSANEKGLFLGCCSPSSTLLYRFSTNKARVIYILKTPPHPQPALLCSFSCIFTYFTRNLPVFKASGLKFYQKKTCAFLLYLKSPIPPPPPLQKSALLSSVN